MDEVIKKLTGFGIPAIIFLGTVSANSFTGAAAITYALAAIGPGGMVGGVIFLLIAAVASTALADYGVDELLKGVIKLMLENGETKESLKKKVEKWPIAKKTKLKLYDFINNIDK